MAMAMKRKASDALNEMSGGRNAVKRRLDVSDALNATSGGRNAVKRRLDVRCVYSLQEELGRGEMGVTRLCKHKATGETFACKSIAKKAMTEEDYEAVKREVLIMRRLSGAKGIASLKEVYEDERAYHLVMECCVGGELLAAVNSKAEGHYGEREAATLIRKIVEGVQTCHEAGVIHGDLKMENVLFSTKETTAESPIKLIDFGLSSFFKHGEFINKFGGTHMYMAPEVYRRRYSNEADLWSAGVILYILLCGEYPFQGRTEQDFRDAVLNQDIDYARCPWPKISNGAKDLVKKLLERDPGRRFSAHDVLSHPWIREGP